MSEIVGYILTFAILSAVLLIAMLTFGSANRQAEQRVLDVEAASVAHRVASAIVDADLFRSAHSGLQALSLDPQLPRSFGNDGYTVELCLSTAATAATGGCGTACTASVTGMDTVVVRTRGSTQTESILGATAARSCATSGHILIQIPQGSTAVSLVST